MLQCADFSILLQSRVVQRSGNSPALLSLTRGGVNSDGASEERTEFYHSPDPSLLWKKGGKGFRPFSVAGLGFGVRLAMEDTPYRVYDDSTEGLISTTTRSVVGKACVEDGSPMTQTHITHLGSNTLLLFRSYIHFLVWRWGGYGG